MLKVKQKSIIQLNYKQLIWISHHVSFDEVKSFFRVSELFSDKSNTHEFVDLVKELALPGELTQNRSYDFEFMQVEKPYESYTGVNVRLRYSNNHYSTTA